ncbi:hypothetical protein Tco_0077075, partial [Tanacetum coccineum]
MLPKMMTRSVGRPAAASRGRGTGGQAGRGGGRTRGHSGDQRNGEIGGQGNDQGIGANEGGEGVPDFSTIIIQQLQNLLPIIKEYDGKGGDVVYTRWIEKMESVQDMSGYGSNQKVKYIAGSFV